MADPLTVAVSVVGVAVPALHGTRFLLGDLQKLNDTPKTIIRLKEDIQRGKTSITIWNGGPQPGTLTADPRFAPPEPWDEEVCIRPSIPFIHLTLSRGRRLPRGLIWKAIDEAENRVQTFISAGQGDWQIPADDWDLSEGMEKIDFVVKLYRAPGALRHERLTSRQTWQALQLLQFCGVARGRYEEVYAYLFLDGKKVASIWIESDVPPGDQPDNDNGRQAIA
ncbi:MAG: hypothetical protein Q9225_006956 [Loekoesia sp. 1 TL-2023]